METRTFHFAFQLNLSFLHFHCGVVVSLILAVFELGEGWDTPKLKYSEIV